MMTMIAVVTWGEVKAAMDAGRRAYYVDTGGFWDIVVVDEPMITCNIPQVSFWDELTTNVTQYFRLQHSQDFEANYMPKMIQGGLNKPSAIGG